MMKRITENEKSQKLNNCEEATFLMEKQQVSGISNFEQSQLEFHLIECEACKIYYKQSYLINRILIKSFSSVTSSDTLAIDFKKQLQDQLQDRLNTLKNKTK